MPLIGGGSLLQTSLHPTGLKAPGAAPRLDAVVLTPRGGGCALHHYHRDQSRPDRTWQRGAELIPDAVAAAALAQDAGSRRRHGDLHVLAPTASGVVHLRWPGPPRGVRVAEQRWRAIDLVAPRADAVALLAHGPGLAALVRSGAVVTHFERPLSGPWRAAGVVTDAATGDPALARGPRGLVAVAPVGGRTACFELQPGGWRAAGAAGTAEGLTGPLGLVGLPGGEFLLAVPHAPGFDLLRGRPGSWVTVPGRRGVSVPTDGDPLAAVSLAATRLRGWVQALTQEGTSLFQYHRQEVRGETRWMRSACLRLDDHVPAILDERPSVKVAQVSGSVDSQPPASGRPRVTLSESERTAGVRGTDLGVRVEHAGASYLLFGDTHWANPLWATRDAVARITPRGPVPGEPGVAFHPAPIRMLGGGVTMREYDVPLDGFSAHGAFFLLATSNHFRRHQVMGRSVLARALDDPASLAAGRRGLRFRTLTTLSDYRFVTVSAQVVPGAALPGLPGGHDVVALWGGGAYRADELRLAVLDPEPIAGLLLGDATFPPAQLGLRFYAGSSRGEPAWSSSESDALPLVSPGAYGELSVRWVPALGRYLLLAMSGPDDPVGPTVTLRTSPTPWGPWSPRRILIDWVVRGASPDDPASRFIRAGLEASEPVGDRVFRAQRSSTGGAYAPYLFDARVAGGQLVLRYTLSTWNPYQVVLMEHRLELDEVGSRPAPSRRLGVGREGAP